MNRYGQRTVPIAWLTLFAVGLAILVTIALSVNILPAAPLGPTPTWPEGITLPDKLPRIPPP